MIGISGQRGFTFVKGINKDHWTVLLEVGIQASSYRIESGDGNDGQDEPRDTGTGTRFFGENTQKKDL
jgi:hypothetical protein